MLTQDQQNSSPKKATATVCAQITPDDAMALSIELQKAGINARVSEAPPVVAETYEIPEPDSLGG
jgi:hypothetical protein